MGKSKKNNSLSISPANKPDKVVTYAGKETARVTKIYNKDDGVYKATRKINKDGSITDKIEHRHP